MRPHHRVCTQVKSSQNVFYWCVMYEQRPVVFYPTHRDAKHYMFEANRGFAEHNINIKYWIKRFRFNFKGSEIDIYEHEFKRKEKK